MKTKLTIYPYTNFNAGVQLGTDEKDWKSSHPEGKFFKLVCGVFFLALMCFVNIKTVWADSPLDTLQPSYWYKAPDSSILSSSGQFPNPVPPGYMGPEAVILAWGGGAYDTQRDRLMLWGGGHGDYGGNELYAFNINTFTWQRIWGPSANIPGVGGTCYEAYSDGNPASRHTYDGIEYLPNQDIFWGTSGSLYCGSGGGGKGTWTYNFGSSSWTRREDAPDNMVSVVSAYHSGNGKIYRQGTTRFSEYNPATHTWTNKGAADGGWWEEEMTAAIDPERNLFVAVGNGKVKVWDLNNFTLRYQSTSGDNSIVGARGPAFEYDPVMKKFVGWANGTSIWILDPANWTWTEQAAATGNSIIPTNQDTHGTFGRWRYVPSKNLYVLVNSTNQSVYFYKLTDGGATLPVCGDGICNGTETNGTCPQDCEAVPPGQWIDLPINTWVARSMPSSNSPQGPIKDLRLAYNPDDKLVYIFGGDYLGPGNASSGRTEMYAYSVENDQWDMVHSMCLPAGQEQPKGPDEAGWVWDSSRKKFWWVPGFSHNANPDNCQSTMGYYTMMSFDPANVTWTSDSYAEPPTNGGDNCFSQYDPATDTIIKFVAAGSDPSAHIYNISQNSWTIHSTPGLGSAYIGMVHSAMDSAARKIYAIDAPSDALWIYDMDSQKFSKKSVPFDIGAFSTEWGGLHNMRVFWDSVNRILLFPQINGNEGLIHFHTYKPSTDQWEIQKPITTLPAGLTLRANSGIYDPDQNVLVMLGGSSYANPYLFLYRYGNGDGSADVTAPAVPGALIIR